MKHNLNETQSGDKYSTVLDLIEHPERYTPEMSAKLLADPDTREIYNILCKTCGTLHASGPSAHTDIDEEWKKFAKLHLGKHNRFTWKRNSAAAIAILTISSLTAIAIGIAMSTNLPVHSGDTTEDNNTPITQNRVTASHKETESDSITQLKSPVIFEDESLATILRTVAAQHSVSVTYLSSSTPELHLYYKYDPPLKLDDIVEQLNTFGQINIRIEGENLIVD